MNPDVPAERVESLMAAKSLVRGVCGQLADHIHAEGEIAAEHQAIADLASALLLILERVPEKDA